MRASPGQAARGRRLQPLGIASLVGNRAMSRAAVQRVDHYTPAADASRREEGGIEWAEPGSQQWQDYVSGAGQGPPAAMNCWEYVLYIGRQAGDLTPDDLRGLYTDEYGETNTSEGDAVVRVFTPEGAHRLDLDAVNPEPLSAGDAIVLDMPARHVALSLGGQQVADLGGNLRSPSFVSLPALLGAQRRNLKRSELARHLEQILVGADDDLKPWLQDLLDQGLPELSGEADWREVESFALALFSNSMYAVPAQRPPKVTYLGHHLRPRMTRAQVGRVMDLVFRATRLTHVYRIPKATWIERVREEAARALQGHAA